MGCCYTGKKRGVMTVVTVTYKSLLDRCSQNLSQNDDRCLMRNTLVLRVLGSLPACAPGDPLPPTTAEADAGPLAASHMADTDAEPLMPSAPNLKTVPPAADDPRRRGPSADAGGDEMVGDSMAVAADAAPAATVNDRRRLRLTVPAVAASPL